MKWLISVYYDRYLLTWQNCEIIEWDSRNPQVIRFKDSDERFHRVSAATGMIVVSEAK